MGLQSKKVAKQAEGEEPRMRTPSTPNRGHARPGVDQAQGQPPQGHETSEEGKTTREWLQGNLRATVTRKGKEQRANSTLKKAYTRNRRQKKTNTGHKTMETRTASVRTQRDKTANQQRARSKIKNGNR